MTKRIHHAKSKRNRLREHHRKKIKIVKNALPCTRKLDLGINGGGVFARGSHCALGASLAALHAVDNVTGDLHVVVLNFCQRMCIIIDNN